MIESLAPEDVTIASQVADQDTMLVLSISSAVSISLKYKPIELVIPANSIKLKSKAVVQTDTYFSSNAERAQEAVSGPTTGERQQKE